MKRRSVVATIGVTVTGAAVLGTGALTLTQRWHRSPKRHPKLTQAHLGATREAALAAGEDRPRVLFVGNSNTLRHDIPARVADLADRAGTPVFAATAAANGAWLVETARLPEFQALLREVPWDVLVLQDFSRVALRSWDRTGSARSMRWMAGQVPGARVVLFPNWPDQAGHGLYTGARGWFREVPAGPEDFARRTMAFYGAVARDSGFAVAGVPESWLAATASGQRLYAPDGHHASPEGAALVAGLLYGEIAAALKGKGG